jgi:hypothetical protein
MVKIGFIVEGDSEKVMVESPTFQAWAKAQGLEICSPVINAQGGGNLLPHHMGLMVARLAPSGPEHIIVLTDLDDAPDIAAVKQRITPKHTQLIFVAVKALEAWFLADTVAMRRWLGNHATFHEPAPEATPKMPWDHLKKVASDHGARGPGSNKVIFAKRFCGTHGFALARAAAHEACPSARVFHDTLVGLGENLF